MHASSSLCLLLVLAASYIKTWRVVAGIPPHFLACEVVRLRQLDALRIARR
jgi:hypothetical protein